MVTFLTMGMLMWSFSKQSAADIYLFVQPHEGLMITWYTVQAHCVAHLQCPPLCPQGPRGLSHCNQQLLEGSLVDFGAFLFYEQEALQLIWICMGYEPHLIFHTNSSVYCGLRHFANCRSISHTGFEALHPSALRHLHWSHRWCQVKSQCLWLRWKFKLHLYLYIYNIISSHSTCRVKRVWILC